MQPATPMAECPSTQPEAQAISRVHQKMRFQILGPETGLFVSDRQTVAIRVQR
ncbi:hypothetical protein AK972_1424 [Pseudomonas yamanorum]|nr:hypothetical protein AK972_1424 [Pseudomonas yamanorum]